MYIQMQYSVMFERAEFGLFEFFDVVIFTVNRVHFIVFFLLLLHGFVYPSDYVCLSFSETQVIDFNHVWDINALTSQFNLFIVQVGKRYCILYAGQADKIFFTVIIFPFVIIFPIKFITFIMDSSITAVTFQRKMIFSQGFVTDFAFLAFFTNKYLFFIFLVKFILVFGNFVAFCMDPRLAVVADKCCVVVFDLTVAQSTWITVGRKGCGQRIHDTFGTYESSNCNK